MLTLNVVYYNIYTLHIQYIMLYSLCLFLCLFLNSYSVIIIIIIIILLMDPYCYYPCRTLLIYPHMGFIVGIFVVYYGVLHLLLPIVILI